MAVRSITEIVRREAEKDDQSTGTLVRFFRVLAQRGDTENTILDNPGLPQYYDAHPVASGYVVKRLRISVVSGTSNIWDVEIGYGAIDPTSAGSRNPIQRNKFTSVAARETDVILQKDLDGRKFETSAKEAFRDPPPWRYSYGIITVVRNELTANATAAVQKIAQYINTVCSHSLFGQPAECAWMADMQAVEKFDADLGLSYWEWTYTIELKAQVDDANTSGGVSLGKISPWKKQLRNMGFKYKKTAGGTELLTFKSDDGENTEVERDLKADGTKLPDGDAPNYLTFRGYPVVNWYALGLE